MLLTSFLPLLATFATFATASPAATTSAPAGPTQSTLPRNFQVTDFVALCTKSFPPSCRFDFNVTVDHVPGKPRAECSFKDTAKDYVICGFGIPEQSFGAYVVKPPNGDATRGNLKVRFRDMFSQPQNSYTAFGNKTLTPGLGKKFSFKVTKTTFQ